MATGHKSQRWYFVAALALLLTPASIRFDGAAVTGAGAPAPVTSPRLYVFDLGKLTIPDPKNFGFTREELATTDLVVAGYLIVHPKGLLQWDTGVVPDAEVGTAVRGAERAEGHRLKDELMQIGYQPSDVTFFGLSHYHSDHTANANYFAASTWLVRKAERDLMFAEKPPGIMNPAHFSELKNAKTIIIDKDDFDVFGDGTVVVKSTPGHTPGHQVLVVKLPKTGTIVLVGDLYHYPEERTAQKFPTFEFNVEQSRASRMMIEDFVKKNNAQLWIEHDYANHAKLKKSPAYYE
jgi:N-acyl homoserine lactone hydrolase